MPTAKTARSAVAVMTAVAVVADSEVVMIAVVHLRAVTALAVVLLRVVMALVADSVLVDQDKAARRAVMAMTAVARRVALVIVIAMARRSVSGWRFRRMCRSPSSQMTRRWMH